MNVLSPVENPCEVFQVMEQRVEDDVHYQSRPADVERNLASSCRVVDARKGSGEKDERQSRRHDAQISHGGVRDMLFQLEDVQDGAGEKKEQASPADGDEQGNRNVVRGKAACVLFAACTDGLAYADFGAHFIEQGDGAGHPRQYAYRTYCSHGLTAQTPYPAMSVRL